VELVGRVISHYQFIEKLGAGGMGDIYRAHDARLNRFVAVKVLSSANAGDPERRRRFIQEAQAASGLNHPNIITIHDIVNEPEGDYMVMEYVSGKTLVDLIPKGGLRAAQALKYGVQMADALSAAHAAGIVHRDLKPGNVMVTDSGLVKVLDFGLAKLTDRGPASNIGDNTQTIAEAPLTVEGSIIGTVSYMSPEQAQGKKVDTRSDIFSFGVVFYEMLTGTRAFSGDSALSTLSAILRDEHKPMVQIAPDVPPQLELLITRCLRKNPDERWQSMKDVLAALGALKHESDSGQLYRSRIQAVEMRPQAPVPVPKKSSAPLLAGIGALVLLLGGGAAGGWWWMKHHNVAPPAPIVVEVPVPAAPAVVPAPVEAPPAEAVMNNDNIIELVTEKVPVSVILSQIRAASKTDFVLTSAEVIRLSKAHVPGPVIEAMRDPKRIPVQPADATNAANNTKKTQAVAAAKQTVAPAPAPVTPPVSQPQNTAKATTASPVPVPAPAKPAAPAAVPVSVGDGMPFSIKLAEDVPTDAEEGRILRFTVVDGLKVGDNVVIAKGAAVTGSILEAAKKKAFGIGGKMQFRLLQVDAVDGKKINVRAEPSRGKDGPAKRPIDSGAKGKTKEIAAAAGSQYVGYIEGDQTVSVKK
jgi:serine/threonine-protein kinase